MLSKAINICISSSIIISRFCPEYYKKGCICRGKSGGSIPIPKMSDAPY